MGPPHGLVSWKASDEERKRKQQSMRQKLGHMLKTVRFRTLEGLASAVLYTCAVRWQHPGPTHRGSFLSIGLIQCVRPPRGGSRWILRVQSLARWIVRVQSVGSTGRAGRRFGSDELSRTRMFRSRREIYVVHFFNNIFDYAPRVARGF